MPEHGSEYVIYGLGPEGPLGFTAPLVEATPDQPLPDAGPFLRVFSGAEEPSTALLRYGQEFIGIWRYVYDHGTGSTKPGWRGSTCSWRYGSMTRLTRTTTRQRL
jgi:hypothetical protein